MTRRDREREARRSYILDVDLCISQYVYTLRTVLYQALFPTCSFATFEAKEYLQHHLDLFERGIRSQDATP